MAQFDHYATWEDSLAMLRDVLTRGDIRAYLREYYPAPEAPSFRSLSPALEARLRQGASLFLAGDFSTNAPIFYQQRGGPHAGMFYLREIGGGPLLSWVLARDNFVEGRRRVLPGLLGAAAEYELTPGNWVRASAELKAAYADLSKRMKKHLVRWEGLWISRGALQLLRDGQAELPGPLQKLGEKAHQLPPLGPAVPPRSRKTARRKVAARTAST